jgi:eukaryotic-like serine/threonine-protein kinase
MQARQAEQERFRRIIEEERRRQDEEEHARPAPSPKDTSRPRKSIINPKIILLVALTVLLMLGSIGFAFNLHQTGINDANATATTQPAQATDQANAATQAAQATANAQATAAAVTATAEVIAANPDPYPPAGTLVLFDPLSQSSTQAWSSGSQCQFVNGQYQVSQSVSGYVNTCSESTTFSHFAVEVRMTIIQGDWGGLRVLDNGSGNFYLFGVCQNGIYFLIKYTTYRATTLVSGSSSAINQGTNQSNVIALTTGGGIFNLYINNHFVKSANDSTYSQGTIGLIAYDQNNATIAAYQNAKVWTF